MVMGQAGDAGADGPLNTVASSPSQSSLTDSSSTLPTMPQDGTTLPLIRLDEEMDRVSQDKQTKMLSKFKDTGWKDSIRQKIEAELSQRVREALDTPPRDKLLQKEMLAYEEKVAKVDENNSTLLAEGDLETAKNRRLRTLKHKHYVRRIMSMSSNNTRLSFNFNDRLSRTNDDMYSMIFGLDSFDDGYNESSAHEKFRRRMLSQTYSKTALMDAIESGRFYDGSMITRDADGNFLDSRGIIRSCDGPFWPPECTPMHAAPMFKWDTKQITEPLWNSMTENNKSSFDTQKTRFSGTWRGNHIVYDSEKSPANHHPPCVSPDLCPSLAFESRFESGNLRQAKRVGHYEYELVLRTDLYTVRHTQWFFFRVSNTLPGIIYKFRIVNFLKKDSLYNHGMQPLIYSTKNVKLKDIGWIRAGHNISYSRNVMHLHSPLLMRGMTYHELEWQMEFPHSDDTVYLAHCYPYTFSDLRMDLNFFMMDIYRAPFIKQEVLCESRAGNACYVLTVSDNACRNEDDKKVVVVTARVHPGETNASWMMRGFIDYITGPDPTAQELREEYVFKIIPMLNPDGVIVGNYRCSLAARDLNRNYRRPRKDLFPTVWHTKEIVETMNLQSEVVLYCDLHGHSRKQNIFMYGNNTSENLSGQDVTQAIVNERIFPWMVAQRCCDAFSFPGCKFQMRPCKEATGRVVMWRQLRIANSFTMEASFCGTTRSDTDRRHFNTSDLQRMGQKFGRVIHDYHRLLTDKTYEREVILDLTCHLTKQIMERRGRLAAGNATEMQTAILSAGDASRLRSELIAGRQLGTDGELDGAQNSIIETIAKTTIDKKQPEDFSIHLQNTTNEKTSKSSYFSKFVKTAESLGDISTKADDIHVTNQKQDDKVIGDISDGTVNSCMKLLHQLNVSGSLTDSDSSDSDSESEAEMKPAPISNKIKRKKRKKNRKAKKLELSRFEMGDKKNEDQRPKTVMAPTTQITRPMPPKSGPLFVSKFEGRHNNGIPCFAEERIQDRATRRLSDIPHENFDEFDASPYPATEDFYVDRLQKLGGSAQYLTTGGTNLQSQAGYGGQTPGYAAVPILFRSPTRMSQHPSSEGSDTEGSRRPSFQGSRISPATQYQSPLPALKRYLTDPDFTKRKSPTKSPTISYQYQGVYLTSKQGNYNPNYNQNENINYNLNILQNDNAQNHHQNAIPNNYQSNDTLNYDRPNPSRLSNHSPDKLDKTSTIQKVNRYENLPGIGGVKPSYFGNLTSNKHTLNREDSLSNRARSSVTVRSGSIDSVNNNFSNVTDQLGHTNVENTQDNQNISQISVESIPNTKDNQDDFEQSKILTPVSLVTNLNPEDTIPKIDTYSRPPSSSKFVDLGPEKLSKVVFKNDSEMFINGKSPLYDESDDDFHNQRQNTPENSMENSMENLICDLPIATTKPSNISPSVCTENPTANDANYEITNDVLENEVISLENHVHENYNHVENHESNYVSQNIMADEIRPIPRKSLTDIDIYKSKQDNEHDTPRTLTKNLHLAPFTENIVTCVSHFKTPDLTSKEPDTFQYDFVDKVEPTNFNTNLNDQSNEQTTNQNNISTNTSTKSKNRQSSKNSLKTKSVKSTTQDTMITESYLFPSTHKQTTNLSEPIFYSTVKQPEENPLSLSSEQSKKSSKKSVVPTNTRSNTDPCLTTAQRKRDKKKKNAFSSLKGKS